MARQHSTAAQRHPASPLTVDIIRLGRRPGSMLTLRNTIPSPLRIGAAVIAIEQGAPLDLDLRLESVSEGVLVTGTVAAATTEDDEVGRVVDDTIDLEQSIIDAVGLELPFSPLCGPDCPGLCPECGVQLAEAPGHHHDLIDPRWAKLAGMVPPKPTELPEPDASRGER